MKSWSILLILTAFSYLGHGQMLKAPNGEIIYYGSDNGVEIEDMEHFHLIGNAWLTGYGSIDSIFAKHIWIDLETQEIRAIGVDFVKYTVGSVRVSNRIRTSDEPEFTYFKKEDRVVFTTSN